MPSEPAARRRACPLCGKPRDDGFKPFCSRGCRDRDLNNWFGDGYRFAAPDPPDSLSDGGDGDQD